MSKESDSPLLLYQTPDGRTRLEVRRQGETVWLTRAQLAELFRRERSVITKHIRNNFEEGEAAVKRLPQIERTQRKKKP